MWQHVAWYKITIFRRSVLHKPSLSYPGDEDRKSLHNVDTFLPVHTVLQPRRQLVTFNVRDLRLSALLLKTQPAPHVTLGQCAVGFGMWGLCMYTMTQHNNSEDMTKSSTFKALGTSVIKVGTVNSTPCNEHGILLSLFHQSLPLSTSGHESMCISKFWKQKTVNNFMSEGRTLCCYNCQIQMNNLRIPNIKIIVFTQEYFNNKLLQLMRPTIHIYHSIYESWNFNFGNAAVTFDTAHLQSSYFHRPSMYSPKLCRTRSQHWGSRMMPLAAPVLLMVRTERSTAESLNPPCNCPIR